MKMMPPCPPDACLPVGRGEERNRFYIDIRETKMLKPTSNVTPPTPLSKGGGRINNFRGARQAGEL